MPAFQFDSNGIDPSYGGGQSQLPVGKHPVVIVGTELKPTKTNDGGYLAITLEAIDGPAKAVQHTDRLNLHNKNAQTVQIANQQLSAYCHVIGLFRFQATEELHGKPFIVEIVPDTGANNEGRTKIGKLFDINGNAPGAAGAGAQQGGGFGNASGGFQPGAGAQGNSQGGDASSSQGAGSSAAGNNGGGWGNGAQGGQQGGGAAASGAGAWSQGSGAAQGGGQPGWGAR